MERESAETKAPRQRLFASPRTVGEMHGSVAWSVDKVQQVNHHGSDVHHG